MITRPKMTLHGITQNYRYCDNIWTFAMNNCEVKAEQKTYKSKYCKIIAFDSLLAGDPNKMFGEKKKDKPHRKQKNNLSENVKKTIYNEKAESPEF